MSKKDSRNRKKNSKPVTKPVEKQQAEQKLKITKDTQCVLTIKEEGRYSHRQSNASSKELCRKLAYTPGKAPKNAPYPKGKEYLEPIYHECTRRMVMTSDAVQYAISDENRPYFMKEGAWKTATKKQRLEANLALISEGKPFSYELID